MSKEAFKIRIACELDLIKHRRLDFSSIALFGGASRFEPLPFYRIGELFSNDPSQLSFPFDSILLLLPIDTSGAGLGILIL